MHKPAIKHSGADPLTRTSHMCPLPFSATALTTVPFFAHHGVIFVPLGFTTPELNKLDEVIGGSAYGAATITGGDGSR